MKKLFLLIGFAIAHLGYAQKPVEVIPFEFVNGHIRIQLSINEGEEMNFVFDTGAAANLLSDKSAEKLGLDLSGSTSVQGASGSSSMKMAPGNSFKAGNTNFKNQTFVVMNIDHLGEEGSPIDGVLGASILFPYKVEIDYDRSEIKLFESIDDLKLDDWQVVEFDLSQFRIPIISATLKLKNGESFTGKYFVDTGAALAVMFNSNLVKEENLIEKLGEHFTYTSTSLSNSDEDEISRIPEYEFFGHTFKNFEARLSQATSGVNSFQGFHGILGSHILKRFNTVFDYADRKMYIKPNRAYDEPFSLNYSGLFVRKVNSNYRVMKVYEDSAAEAAGIQVGDIIESLDNQIFDTRSEFYDYFQSTKVKIQVKLKRKGKSLNLKLSPKPVIN